MLEAVVSVPSVTVVAVATTTIFVMHMLEGEKAGGRDRATRSPNDADVQSAGRALYLWYGMPLLVILIVLVVLRFVTLAG